MPMIWPTFAQTSINISIMQIINCKHINHLSNKQTIRLHNRYKLQWNNKRYSKNIYNQKRLYVWSEEKIGDME